MSATGINRSCLLAAVAVLGAAAWATAPAAQANPALPLPLDHPGCQSYKFVGLQVFDGDDGTVVNLPSSNTTIIGDANLSGAGLDGSAGHADGGVTGEQIDITVTWNKGPLSGASSHYFGLANDNGSAGGVVDRTNGKSASWRTRFNDRIVCTQPGAVPQTTEQPKQGPTVSYDLIPGGVVAHITDRSGVTAQCTYTSDFYTSSFALTANSKFDLRIVPAFPELRNWPVNISCDNGTSTQTTEFF